MNINIEEADRKTLQEKVRFIKSNVFEPKMNEIHVIIFDILRHYGILSDDTVLALVEQISTKIAELDVAFNDVCLMVASEKYAESDDIP